jgi:murein L,D-transpeptidase YafK
LAFSFLTGFLTLGCDTQPSSPQLASQTTSNPSESAAQPPSLQDLLGSDFKKERVSILVEKSKYKLTVLYDEQPVKSYPIVLGGSPAGDKRVEGDRKTPEGIYYEPC